MASNVLDRLLASNSKQDWEIYWNEYITMELLSSSEDQSIRPPRLPRDAYSKLIIDGKVKYKCKFPGCNKEFNSKRMSAKSHWLTHNNMLAFKCSYCSAQFTRNYDKKRHEMERCRQSVNI